MFAKNYGFYSHLCILYVTKYIKEIMKKLIIRQTLDERSGKRSSEEENPLVSVSALTFLTLYGGRATPGDQPDVLLPLINRAIFS